MKSASSVTYRGRARVATALAGTLVMLLSTLPVVATEVGTVSADMRVRYETADIDGLDDAHNLSGRLRLGYMSPEWTGLRGVVGGEFTGVADEGAYNAAGVHGDASRAVIADPKNVELDALFLVYTNSGVSLSLGRQPITLDNHRFIGDVGWRQNRQTYDAAAVRITPATDVQVFYAFVDNVVRIFGSEAPDQGANAGESESSSHLMNLAYQPAPKVKLVAYSYLLDLADLPPTSSVNTYGASAQAGMQAGNAVNVDGRIEYAYQTDAGDNTLDYGAHYCHLALNATMKAVTGGLGYERLGADDTGRVDADGNRVYASFQTPLATLHKFNGFADRFLVTPPKGLEDCYVSLGWRVPLPEAVGPLTATVIYHDFRSAEGSEDLGDEWDGVLVKPLVFERVPGTFKLIAKAASYRKGDSGADTDRASVELNYSIVF